MKQPSRTFLLCFAGGLFAVVPAFAGPNSEAKILLHLTSTTTKNHCTWNPALPACGSIDVSGALYPQTYFAYLLVTDGDATAGLAGVQCGIAYAPASQSGVDVYSWHLCATLQFQGDDWPDSGAGNMITWNADSVCQTIEPGGTGTGVTATAGYFYCTAYSADTLRVVVRPIDSLAAVTSCEALADTVASDAVTFTPSHLGSVVFSTSGTANGHNPCGQ